MITGGKFVVCRKSWTIFRVTTGPVGASDVNNLFTWAATEPESSAKIAIRTAHAEGFGTAKDAMGRIVRVLYIPTQNSNTALMSLMEGVWMAWETEYEEREYITSLWRARYATVDFGFWPDGLLLNSKPVHSLEGLKKKLVEIGFEERRLGRIKA